MEVSSFGFVKEPICTAILDRLSSTGEGPSRGARVRPSRTARTQMDSRASGRLAQHVHDAADDPSVVHTASDLSLTADDSRHRIFLCVEFSIK